MKTQYITNSGIDRNFLRECERQGLISPKRNDNEWIVNKNYKPREYSQEDLEIVWNAYLCRKMGLSYAQIKDLTQGEEISVRNSLNELIRKYEQQIEELQALIEFMKYVKGIGFVPTPPNVLMGSTNFTNYLTDFIQYLDEDKKLKKVLGLMEYISEVDDIQNPPTEDLDRIEVLSHGLMSEFNEEDSEAYSSAILKLKDLAHLNPSCDEVQNVIHRIFYYQKRLNHNENLTAGDFASGFVFLFSYDSDMSVAYKKILGEKAFDFFNKALLEFLVIQEPNKIKRIREVSQQTDEVNQ